MRFKEILKEHGRIVQGVNTTVDVSVDEIKTQAAKFGFDVDEDGQPPTFFDRKRKVFKKPEKRTPKRENVTGDYPENLKNTQKTHKNTWH